MSSQSLKKLRPVLKFVYSGNDTISIIFQNNDLLMGVIGEFNSNLKELEKLTGANIYFRGNSILIKNKTGKNEIVKNAIQFLAEQFINNGSIEKKDIISSINKFMIEEKNNKSNQNIEYIIKTPKKSVIPRSERQKKYVRALRESDIIISAGPAGTGKTFLAVAVALTMLLEKKIERIILSRPAVEAGERLGFLPGDMKEKVDPYLRPLYDSLLGISVKASVGINRDPKFKMQIHKKLLEVSEVISISEVTGRFDIIIQVYTQDLEDLHTVVIEKIGKIEGIQNTETFVELQKTDKEPVYLTKNV